MAARDRMVSRVSRAFCVPPPHTEGLGEEWPLIFGVFPEHRHLLRIIRAFLFSLRGIGKALVNRKF